MIAEIIGVAGVLIPTAIYAWDKWASGRVVVRQLQSQRDEALTPLLELYTELFPDDGTNYSADEMAGLLPDESGDEIQRHVVVNQFVLVAKRHRAVIGFAFCHYYPRSRGAVISYFGIDRTVREARAGATQALLTSLVRKLKAAEPPCEFVVFELQKPGDGLAEAENAERRARPVLFKRRAKDFGLGAFELPISYCRPKLSLESPAEGEPLALMCAIFGTQRLRAVTRIEAERILRCLHLDGYGDFYDVADPRHEQYLAYLSTRVDSLMKVMPEAIAVR